jgi:hypothetical protein
MYLAQIKQDGVFTYLKKIIFLIYNSHSFKVFTLQQ